MSEPRDIDRAPQYCTDGHVPIRHWSAEGCPLCRAWRDIDLRFAEIARLLAESFDYDDEPAMCARIDAALAEGAASPREDVGCPDCGEALCECPREVYGWAIEGSWSPTDRPEYWAGSSVWSTDPYRALRFAAERDARQAAELMLDGINTRICEHLFAIGAEQATEIERLRAERETLRLRTEAMQRVAAEADKVRAEVERLRVLVDVLIDNRPDDGIADNGITVYDQWLKDALCVRGRGSPTGRSR